MKTSDLTQSPEAMEAEQAEVRKLLRGIANGDRQAFEEFHERFSGMVYATVIQVLHHQEDAQDTVQEVFAALWQKAGMYCEAKGKPATWLGTLARNRAIDRLRSRQRRGKLSERFEQEISVDGLLTKDDPSSHASIRELAHFARSAVMQLSDEQRAAIQLAFFEGLTQLEVAQRIGQPLGTVKARIRRGLGKLREMMGESPDLD